MTREQKEQAALDHVNHFVCEAVRDGHEIQCVANMMFASALKIQGRYHGREGVQHHLQFLADRFKEDAPVWLTELN